ncbi:hypothetical protein BU25DRAFT_389110 [Macroventuria anomochaeta]|uniref:Uncharacterized protein n=1 Tax=Macroventuria anomochaeta TaxID=301207 RepID=A0ACB6S6Z2_9PLEO|nr:uncharacterized protein BU25DRAFT_389110 [Macroventuria anomochaeta]KAF2629808.1 hypothetical protein BU25DRAFT_389110 [Macroventuria anomochaeta]
MAKKPAASQHFCGRCPQTFNTRQALNKHLQNHPDSEAAVLNCAVCNWPFDDSLDLEKHSITTGHSQATILPQEYVCNRCSQNFSTQRDYNCHRELGEPCCDAFHASDWKKGPRPGYIGPDKPKLVSREVKELAYGSDSSDSPSDMSEGRVCCKHCRKTFASEFSHDCHLLGCKPFNSKLTPDLSLEILRVRDQDQYQNVAQAKRHTTTLEVIAPHMTNSTTLADASWPTPLQTVTLNTSAPVFRQSLPFPTAPRDASSARSSGIQNIGGALEMEQAKSICGKTLRLLLQTDIFIHHDGKMSVGGIDWTRIGVERQSAVVGMFDDMCHLPRKLQSLEYVPAPKTFMAEYTAQYPVTEFESAPARNPAKPGLGIIAMACSKITLSNRCQEVVKIAAVDVLTCRVLMSHLVCTDPNAQVANWHSSVTGLTSLRDMEDARQAGYRVLKSWAAARSALFKFIDRDTIIIGHNLRSELDALRIIHGRAVDIAKVVEKAAQGPLSKAQVSLDSWCRDVANVARLKTDPVFGRDCVMSAFAAREIGLWAIKNREKFENVAKQKTQEYQMVLKA